MNDKHHTAMPGRGTSPVKPSAAYLVTPGESYNDRRDRQRAGSTDGPAEAAVAAGHTGTSIFDPVLCELAYRWFCPPEGLVLDPFAGGSVRGIVASQLKRRYLGVDLSDRQIVANTAQAQAICDPQFMPEWIVGDSRGIATLAIDRKADFIFSCPPYADLEIYSDDERDISTLPYGEFMFAYRQIIAATCTLLKPNRFACFVVGEVRGRNGAYYGFVPDTVDAFKAAGLDFYNEAILVTAAGSLPIRTAKQFEVSRKLGKTHQNVLVFVKGDPRKATELVGDVEYAIDIGEPGRLEEVPASDVPSAAVVVPPGPVRWKVSAKWLGRQHDCTLAGITHRCGGGCCRAASFWPPKAYGDGIHPTDCGMLGPAGCTFTDDDKPVTCHLYPLMLNDNGTLILHHRTTSATSVCKGNHGHGPPIVVALENNLVSLFGREQYDRVRTDVLAGRDSWFEPSSDILAAIEREHALAARNAPPEPRSKKQSVLCNDAPGLFTPIERHGAIWVKRDDLFEHAGVRGGKVRTCLALAKTATGGLVTAGSRASPQVNIVARVAELLGLPCRAHVPSGALAPEVEDAAAHGAEIVQHSPGYNTVIIARARADAAERGWTEIPFGMECQEAVEQTAGQVADIPDGVKRLVVPVGSGMTLAGILAGLDRIGRSIPILGVVVGADPTKRLDRYAPGWRDRVDMQPAGVDYHTAIDATVGGVMLDQHYEAKGAKFVRPDDLFWIVGIRATQKGPAEPGPLVMS